MDSWHKTIHCLIRNSHIFIISSKQIRNSLWLTYRVRPRLTVQFNFSQPATYELPHKHLVLGSYPATNTNPDPNPMWSVYEPTSICKAKGIRLQCYIAKCQYIPNLQAFYVLCNPEVKICGQVTRTQGETLGPFPI